MGDYSPPLKPTQPLQGMIIDLNTQVPELPLASETHLRTHPQEPIDLLTPDPSQRPRPTSMTSAIIQRIQGRRPRPRSTYSGVERATEKATSNQATLAVTPAPQEIQIVPSDEKTSRPTAKSKIVRRKQNDRKRK